MTATIAPPIRLSKPEVLMLAHIAAHPGATPEQITVGTFNRDTGRVRARTKILLEQLRRAGLIEREPGRAESHFTLTVRADGYIKPYARRGN